MSGKPPSFQWNLRKKSLSGWSRASVLVTALVGHLELSRGRDERDSGPASGCSVKPVLLAESWKKHPGFGSNALSSLGNGLV